MIVDNDVAHDARVRKEAASLAAAGWRVVVVGISRSGPEPDERHEVDGYTIICVIARWFRASVGGKFGFLVRTIEGFLRASIYLRRVNAHVYHAHDFTGLVIVALAGIWRRPVVYDSHEIYFERPMQPLTQVLSYFLCPLERFLARRASRMIATTDSRAYYFEQHFGVRSPVIVRNAVDLRAKSSSPVRFSVGLPYTVVHSGWLMHGRHLSELVAALPLLPENVSLVLVGDGWLRERLEDEARTLGVGDRFEVVGKIAPQQMVATLEQATLAVVLIESESVSYRLSLPNKFFEAVAAGLPIVATPIPEVKKMVETYELGVLCDPLPESIAQAIMTVLEPETLKRIRANVSRARAELNWEAEERKIVQMYQEILG